MDKKLFKKTILFIRDQRKKWDKLVDAMSALSPGNYIDFWPEFSYDELITELLDNSFGFESSWSPIDYFVIEGNFGKDNLNELKEYSVDNIVGDISTIDKLYEYCLKLKNNLK